MNDFLLHIYNYILEHLETDDPEYEENRTRASAQYGALMQALPPKQAVQLESYQYMCEIARDMEQEAVFLAAFRAGLYLGASAQCP